LLQQQDLAIVAWFPMAITGLLSTTTIILTMNESYNRKDLLPMLKSLQLKSFLLALIPYDPVSIHRR
jgi:hypothetical protein